MMRPAISHDRRNERPEAKARWYQSLSVSERMEVFCSITDLALTLRPDLADKGVEDAQQAQAGIRILRLPPQPGEKEDKAPG